MKIQKLAMEVGYFTNSRGEAILAYVADMVARAKEVRMKDEEMPVQSDYRRAQQSGTRKAE